MDVSENWNFNNPLFIILLYTRRRIDGAVAVAIIYWQDHLIAILYPQLLWILTSTCVLVLLCIAISSWVPNCVNGYLITIMDVHGPRFTTPYKYSLKLEFVSVKFWT